MSRRIGATMLNSAPQYMHSTRITMHVKMTGFYIVDNIYMCDYEIMFDGLGNRTCI
jgi:hypothetical protein